MIALWNTSSIKEFNTLQKLADLMIEINPKFDIPVLVNTRETAEKTQNIMRQFSEETKIMDDKAVAISEDSIFYKTKNRGSKKVSDDSPDKKWTMNPAGS